MGPLKHGPRAGSWAPSSQGSTASSPIGGWGRAGQARVWKTTLRFTLPLPSPEPRGLHLSPATGIPQQSLPQPQGPVHLSCQPPLPPQSDGNLPVCWGERSDDIDEHSELQRGFRGDHISEPEQGGPGLPHQSAGAGPAVSTGPPGAPYRQSPLMPAPTPAPASALRRSVSQLLAGSVFPFIGWLTE